MSLFLSYAQEDETVAEVIARKLEALHHSVYRWQDPKHRGGQFVEAIEREISSAEGFLAVLSPSYLRSPYCRRERVLAIQREIDLQATDANAQFVHVFQVADIPFEDTGFTRSYDWLDATTEVGVTAAVSTLHLLLSGNGASSPDREATNPAATAPATGGRTQPAAPGSPAPVSPAMIFRNRRIELDRLVAGLTTIGGIRSWFIVAPPAMGKSWLLDRVCEELRQHGPTDDATGQPRWEAKLLDIRRQPPAIRQDASTLVDLLFPTGEPVSRGVGLTVPRGTEELAQLVVDQGRLHVCLIDGVELLDSVTVRTLRQQLSEITKLVDQGGRAEARLAVIAAGRRDDDWRGLVGQQLRFTTMPLAEFRPDVTVQALHDLATQMGRQFESSKLQRDAELVHGFTEGLPALLVQCLHWLRQHSWIKPERLVTPALFDTLARPYLEKELLSDGSLFPDRDFAGTAGHADTDSHPDREVIIHSLRVLTPYRLFTGSHLAHHLRSDQLLKQAVAQRGWSPADLWTAMSRISLLSQPANELWQEIHPPIRRLLFRFSYPTPTSRATAHREAHAFVEQWMAPLTDTDLVTAILECLWHRSALLRIEDSNEPADALIIDTLRYCELLRTSRRRFTTDALRNQLTRKLRNDQEIQGNIRDVDGLFDNLIEITLPGPGDHGD